jgi:hypothetical protein
MAGLFEANSETTTNRETSRTYILTLEKELAALAEERNTREQADRITANRPTILAPKSVGQGS